MPVGRGVVFEPLEAAKWVFTSSKYSEMKWLFSSFEIERNSSWEPLAETSLIAGAEGQLRDVDAENVRFK